MDQNPHLSLPQLQTDTGGVHAGLVDAGLQPDTGRVYLLIAPHPAVDRLMDALAVRLALASDSSAPSGGALCRSQSAPPSFNCDVPHSGQKPGALSGGALCRSRSAPAPYLHILDGGNRFDLHGIARGLARGLTGGSMQVEAVLQHIHVARAFTCYQTEALLAGVVDAHRTPPPGARPSAREPSAPEASFPLCQDSPVQRPAAVLVPGLLTPFADENVPRGERLRLLGRCTQHLKRLAQHAPVLVSAAPLPDGVDIYIPEAAGAGMVEFLARLETAADQVWRFEAAGVYKDRRRFSAAPGQLRMF